jgi:hypothetical protein
MMWGARDGSGFCPLESVWLDSFALATTSYFNPSMVKRAVALPSDTPSVPSKR